MGSESKWFDLVLFFVSVYQTKFLFRIIKGHKRSGSGKIDTCSRMYCMYIEIIRPEIIVPDRTCIFDHVITC